MTRILLLGTRNAGKVAELRALLNGLDVELRSVDELADPPPLNLRRVSILLIARDLA